MSKAPEFKRKAEFAAFKTKHKDSSQDNHKHSGNTAKKLGFYNCSESGHRNREYTMHRVALNKCGKDSVITSRPSSKLERKIIATNYRKRYLQRVSHISYLAFIVSKLFF